MNRSVTILLGVAAVAAVAAYPSMRGTKAVVHPGWSANHRFILPNGWRLTPAGKTTPLPGDMPGNILVLKGGRRALVNTCGYHDHSLDLVDIPTGKVVQSIPFNRSWVGLALNHKGEVLVSGGLGDGGNEAVHRISVGDRLTAERGFSLTGIQPKEQFVSSILTIGDRTVLLNIQSDEVLLLDGAGHEIARAKVGYRPFGAALSPDGSTLAVSNWGDKSVTLLDSKTLRHKQTIRTRAMPSVLKYSPDGRLFVSESGSNTVAVIDGGMVKERIRTGIDAKVPVGATPLGLALSPNARTLYVADAGNNCVTVIDVGRRGSSHVVGLIPTERYPTAAAVTPDGKDLLISTAKGYYGPNVISDKRAQEPRASRDYTGPYYMYIGQQLQGRLAIVKVPTAQELRRLTRLCYANRPKGVSAGPGEAVREQIQRGAFDKIKHVLLVIKENRSYDQVLG
ncbi:MAG TPA: hypothetical protein VG944_22295, partial [Fimbriimonas sp.]|nr:hypothetical protein [Fimbriimonas sp.]